jgi:hypothetical protein
MTDRWNDLRAAAAAAMETRATWRAMEEAQTDGAAAAFAAWVDADDDFEATASPAVVLALLAEMDRLRASNAAMREALRKLAAIGNECTWNKRTRHIAADLHDITRAALAAAQEDAA